MKVARTREAIIDAALDLFIDQGYDATTMEQIAERVEIGTSTLYRYFPTKDLLLLDRFSRSMDFGGLLHARPAGEPVAESLRHVICEAIGVPEAVDERFSELRKVVDASPVPRARLWDLFMQARGDLEVELARRLQREPDDLVVLLAARFAFEIYEIAGERWWAGDHRGPVSEVVDGLLTSLADLDLVLPAAPAAARPVRAVSS
jgi:AcrR family transcriptional regulator